VAVTGSEGALSGTLTTADFSGDGHADAAVYGGNWISASQSLAVWRSSTVDGATSWSWTPLTPPTVAAFEAGAVAVANVDPGADDDQDLVALAESRTPGGSALAVYLGNGDGTFQAQIATTGLPGLAYGLTVADVNGDDVADVLIPTVAKSGPEWTAEVVTLIGRGEGHFEAPIVSPVDTAPSEADVLATGIVVGHFTGSGHADIAVSQAFSPPHDLYVLRGDGAGGFTDASPMSLGVGSFGLAAGDFDGNGTADLALPVADPAPAGGTVLGERIVTALGHDDGTFTTLAPAAPKWTRGQNPYSYTIHAADLNGDGLPDLLLPAAADSHEGGVWALLSNGDGTFSAGVPGLDGQDAWDVGAGDFDGDGRPDIVALTAPSPGSGPLELAVYDNAGEPALALGASALDLGEATLGQSASGQLSITNDGGYALAVSALTVDGADAADFTASGCTTTPISPGATCDLDVTFTPSRAAAESATLTIASDDPARPITTVALTGTGKAAGDASGSGPGDGAGPSSASPVAKLTLARTAPVSAKGFASLKLTCAGAPCKGKLTLTTSTKKKGKARSTTLSTGSYALKAGASKPLALKLSAPGLRRLRAAPGRKLTVTVTIIPTTAPKLTTKLTLVGSKRPPRTNRSRPPA